MLKRRSTMLDPAPRGRPPARRGFAFHLPLGAAAIVFALLFAGPTARTVGADRGPHRPTKDAPRIRPTPEDRAVAFACLLDSPMPRSTIDDAIVFAERLRRLYGIDSGNLVIDRQEAARRAVEEVLSTLEFTPEELTAKARTLGYSLDPAACGSTCRNVEALARIELEKEALLAFLNGRPVPGRTAAEVPGGSPGHSPSSEEAVK